MVPDTDIIGLPKLAPRLEARVREVEKDLDPAKSPANVRPEEPAPLGQPTLSPRRLEKLSTRDLKRMEEEEAAADEAAFEAALASKGVKLPGFLFRSTFISMVMALAAAFGLFVFSQALATADSLSRLPEWAQYIGYSGLALLCLVTLAAGVRLLWAYSRLRTNRQVSLAALSDLEKRARLRSLAHRELDRARVRLVEYLRGFAVESAATRDFMRRMGMRDDELDDIETLKSRLIEERETGTAGEWLAEFKNFQAVLDKAAMRRVRAYSLRVGVKTAIIPIPLVDVLIVVYSSFSMIGDLCGIYNLRMNSLSTAVILGRSFINAYLAGEIEEAAEKMFDLMFDGQDVATMAVHGIAPKLVEGKANAFLIYRLGRATGNLLKPVDRN